MSQCAGGLASCCCRVASVPAFSSCLCCNILIVPAPTTSLPPPIHTLNTHPVTCVCGCVCAHSPITPAHPNTDFKWNDYAPRVFRRLRRSAGIDEADYMISLGGERGQAGWLRRAVCVSSGCLSVCVQWGGLFRRARVCLGVGLTGSDEADCGGFGGG